MCFAISHRNTGLEQKRRSGKYVLKSSSLTHYNLLGCWFATQILVLQLLVTCRLQYLPTTMCHLHKYVHNVVEHSYQSPFDLLVWSLPSSSPWKQLHLFVSCAEAVLPRRSSGSNKLALILGCHYKAQARFLRHNKTDVMGSKKTVKRKLYILQRGPPRYSHSI